MYSHKNKTYNQSNMQDGGNRQISPRPLTNKPRKTKDNKIQPSSTLAINSKIKHKPNSKSNLQTIQQRHNNSPIQFNHQQIQNKCINAFSFTHILQQNSKSQHLSSSSSIDQQHMHNSSRFNMKTGDFNKKTTIGSISLTPNTFLNSMLRDATVKESLQESSKNIQHRFSAKQEESKSIAKSVDKQNKKSPLKLVNLNRLSNTPKLKERKEAKPEQKQLQKDNQSSKTFKAVLNNNNKQTKQNKISVNLQCLQKIQSMFNQTQQSKEKPSYTNSKSNLLSTGVININHPQDHIDAVHYRPIYTANSKESFSSKCQPQKTISQQFIQEFHEENEGQNNGWSEELPEKIKNLKERVLLLQNYFAGELDSSCEDKFMMDIENHYNPEVNIKAIDNSIKLIKFKQQMLMKVSEIMQSLSCFSQQIVSHINKIVVIYQESAKTYIDWKQIQESQNRTTMLQIQKIKTDIMLERVVSHQSTVRRIINQHSNNNQHITLQNSLQQLQQQIEAQQHYIKYTHPTLFKQTMLTQIFNSQFKELQTKVQNLHQTLQTLYTESPNLVSH